MNCFHRARSAALISLCLLALLPISASAQLDTIVPVNSPAFVFSPGNWVGDNGRGGTVYRQTWNSGAYFRVAWATTSAQPTATLLLDTSVFGGAPGAAPALTYNVDGVWTDGVPCRDRIDIAGLSGPGSHVLTVYMKNSPQTSRWGSPGVSGTNVCRVTGLQLDSGAKGETAVRQPKWALILGDSITEGIQTNNGDDNLADYSYFVGQALQTQGYEYDVSACGYSGWLRPGDATHDVPGYYVVTGSTAGVGGTYDDANSRWNKIDGNNHSLLDSRGHLSAYGGAGQEPSIVTLNFGTNDGLSHVSESDTQASIRQSLAALRRAAPNAAIFLIIPFGQYDADIIQTSLYAYQSAHPRDKKVFMINLGPSAARTLSAGNYWGGLHPNMRGHAVFAAKILAAIEEQAAPESPATQKATQK